MRYLLAFMLLVGLFMFGRNCHFSSFDTVHGEGPVKTETRQPANFSAVSVAIAGNVDFQLAESYSLEISAQENLLRILKTEVKDGRLEIYFDENVSYDGEINIKIKAPALQGVSVAGSGVFRSSSALQGNSLNLVVAGSGDFIADQVSYESIETNISGSGTIQIGGSAKRLDAQISGSGDLKATQLNIETVDVNIAGSGSMRCGMVSQLLKAQVSGSGDVRYKGQPEVQSQVAGSGTVKAE